MIPSYLGLAHQACTSLICCSYSASSAAPAFWDSGSVWKESEGRVVVIGLSRGFNGAILGAAIERARICWFVYLAGAVPACRGTIITALRSILNHEEKKTRRRIKRPFVFVLTSSSQQRLFKFRYRGWEREPDGANVHGGERLFSAQGCRCDDFPHAPKSSSVQLELHEYCSVRASKVQLTRILHQI